MIFSCQSLIFKATLLKFSFKLHRIFDFHMRVRTCSAFDHPPGLPMPPKPDWHTPYPPPALVPPPPHPPQSTLSRFLAVSRVNTGMHSKIPEFSLPCALGLHSYHLLHLSTMLLPGATICAHLCTCPHLSHTCMHLAYLWCTIAHLFTHICAPSHTFAHPCAPFHTHSRTSALPLHTFCAPSMHPCALCAPSSGFVTLI